MTNVEGRWFFQRTEPCDWSRQIFLTSSPRILLRHCAVLDVSPKASAALSRRLLQRTLHERFSTNRPNLQQEILEFISTLNPPSHLAQQLDAIRSVGNFAAHPIKDTTTGAITDVEEGEAELLIETLESLFDYSFVQPAKWSATKAAINAKLSAAGKPTIP